MLFDPFAMKLRPGSGTIMSPAWKGCAKGRVVKTGQHLKSRIICIALTLVGMCAICSLAIAFLYGLHGLATMYPYKSLFEQGVAVLRTAFIATVASSWAVWFGAKHDLSFGAALLRVSLAANCALTLDGIAGCGGVLGGDFSIAGWHGSTNFIFPSTFFSEYNFLTFIFQVAPVTAISAGVLLYACQKANSLWFRDRGMISTH